MSKGVPIHLPNTSASPEAAALILAAGAPALLASSNQSATLSCASGVFILSWSASDIGAYDWVGLYRSINDADDAQLTYQWATRGSSYTTSEVVQTGYQARYVVWRAGLGKYVSVARTDPFPFIRVCSQ